MKSYCKKCHLEIDEIIFCQWIEMLTPEIASEFRHYNLCIECFFELTLKNEEFNENLKKLRYEPVV